MVAAGPDTPSLVVVGASGFLGRAVLGDPRRRQPAKAIARSIPEDRHGFGPDVTWHRADFTSAGSLGGIIASGDTVVNLVYDRHGTASDNLRLVDALIGAAASRGVRRLIHCSTAVVAGDAPESTITEATPCRPRTSYERTKLAVEARVLEAGDHVDTAIVRPTAILGPGGMNLLKLANALRSGSMIANHARAVLFGRRPMHLVPARTVAGAILHLAAIERPLAGQTFIVAADDDADNNYASVERHLREALGIAPRPAIAVSVPAPVLSAALRALGRAEADVKRVYDASRLRATGFSDRTRISDAVREFALALTETA